MASVIYLNKSVWSSPLVGYNKKQKPNDRGPMLEETRPDYAIRSSLAITKLPLCHDILTKKKKKKTKKNNKKEKCDFLKIFFLWIFKLCGLVRVYTASLLVQEHSKSVL